MKYFLLILIFSTQWLGASQLASEEQLTRRLYLDLLGRTPTNTEFYQAVELLRNRKNTELVDRLLASNDFKDNLAFQIVKHYAPKNERRNNLAERLRLEMYIRENYIDKNNRDFRKFINDMLTARGVSSFNRMVLFYGERESSADLAGRFSQRVLGVPMNCARCHDHKDYNGIKQKDFWALTAFFDNLQKRRYDRQQQLETFERFEKRNNPEEFLGKEQAAALKYWLGKEEAGESIYEDMGSEERMGQMVRRKKSSKAESEKEQKRMERLLVPQIVLSEKNDEKAHAKVMEYEYQGETFKAPMALPFKKGGIRSKEIPRVSLANWVTESTNPYFTHAVANWVGQWLLGKPWVEPVSDVYSSVAQKDPRLRRMALRFRMDGYSIIKLVRNTVLSREYRLINATENDDEAFVNYKVRQYRYLSAEQLFNSMYQDSLRLTGQKRDTASVKKRYQYERKKEQTQARYFPQNIDEYALSYRGSLLQSLYMSQDQQMARYVDLLAKKAYSERYDVRPQDFVQKLIIKLYTRQPTEAELMLLMDHLKTDSEYVDSGYYELVWTLVNSPEMRIY